MDTHKKIASPDTANGGFPEKYIRTFEMDKNALEKGNIPGLVPLEDVVSQIQDIVPEPPVEIKEEPVPIQDTVPELTVETVPSPPVEIKEEPISQPVPELDPLPEPVPTELIKSLAPPTASGETLPEEYIRTFEKDANTLKKGGTPDLTPFEKPEPLPTPEVSIHEPLIEIKEEPVPIQDTVPELTVETVPSPPVEIKEEPVLIPDPMQEEILVPPVELPGPVPLKTYAEDFRDKMNKTHASTATILAAEQDAGPQTAPLPIENSSQTNRNRWSIIAGLFLLIVGSVGIYIAYTNFMVKTAAVFIAPTIATPIFVDTRETVSGTGTALLQSIEQFVQKPLAPDTVRLLSFAPATTSTDVFSALDLHAPDILLRNIDAPHSMAGVISTGNGQSPFFILSVGSYAATFSGMLAWEPTMPVDVQTLFPPYLAPFAATSATSTATATSSVRGSFRDEVVSNHDVRIYRDTNGKSIVLYGYWNQITLVIARDPLAFTEILARLATTH